MRLLRVAIPIIIALMVGSTMLVTWLDPMKVLKKLPVDPGKLVISGTKITMEAPKLSGYTRDHRWYELHAAAAAQDVTKPDQIELREVRAQLETQDKSTMTLSAKDGLFDRKRNVLNLNHNIVLKSSSGYEMRLEEATIETNKGEVKSKKPVAVFSQDATLNADGLEVLKSGEVVRFIGGVVMNINKLPEPGQPAAGPR